MSDRYRPYNPNPIKGNRVGDCTIRAICKATGQSWETVYAGLSAYGFIRRDMPSANSVWGMYLKRMGFTRHIVDDHGQDFYTVKDFCRDNPEGTYILAIDGHVVCVVDGFFYDTWNSGDEIPLYYWTRASR